MKPDIAGLRLVVEAVKKAPEEKLFMPCWEKEQPCGTVRCAIGWFCHFNPDDNLRLISKVDVTLRYENLFGYEAVASRFGLQLNDEMFDYKNCQTRYLFSGMAYDLNYLTPVKLKQTVIDRIETFIKEHENDSD